MAADDWRDAVAMVTAMLAGDGEGFDVVATHASREAVRCVASMAAVSLARWCEAEDVDVPGLLEDLRDQLEERHRDAG